MTPNEETMAIEAEVKACVHRPEDVHARLSEWAKPESATYSDTYFDHDGQLDADDRELRVREIRTGAGVTSLLTYKGPTLDAGSGSKAEYETTVADAQMMRSILGQLGYTTTVAFEKECTNYTFEREGRSVLATVVRVPQIDGTFIEVETIATSEDDLEGVLGTVRNVLRALGIDTADETRETYTAAVLATLKNQPASHP